MNCRVGEGERRAIMRAAGEAIGRVAGDEVV